LAGKQSPGVLTTVYRFPQVSRCASASALYSLKMGVRVDYRMRHAFEQFIEGKLALH
jgi:hypothetical protein